MNDSLDCHCFSEPTGQSTILIIRLGCRDLSSQLSLAPNLGIQLFNLFSKTLSSYGFIIKMFIMSNYTPIFLNTTVKMIK